MKTGAQGKIINLEGVNIEVIGNAIKLQQLSRGEHLKRKDP